jgi:hypothetical protein
MRMPSGCAAMCLPPRRMHSYGVKDARFRAVRPVDSAGPNCFSRTMRGKLYAMAGAETGAKVIEAMWWQTRLRSAEFR